MKNATRAILRMGWLPVVAAWVMGPAAAVGADNPPAPADTSTSSAGGLQEVTVTATRHEESLSKVPISLSVLTQDTMELKGIKDFADVARFTPGVAFDSSQTNAIAIRGISSTGGSGTTGIYIDDVPIQMRELGFNADDTLLKVFDLDRIEVLRGPQGTLFGAGSEGGTVRYITTPPSLTKSSVYAKAESSFTQGGSLSYEAGVAGGGPLVDGVFGVRASAWYRRDGGWIDRLDPTTLQVVDKNANHDETTALRIAALWQPNDALRITPAILYQNRERNDVTIYWPTLSNPSSDRYVSLNPTQRSEPDKLYLPSLSIEADFGSARLISTTAYFHRDDVSGYDGTLYNLGYFQSQALLNGPLPASLFTPSPFPQQAAGAVCGCLLDPSGEHLPLGLENYRAPASVTNEQRNVTEELRLQSTDPNARWSWTVGTFFSLNRQFSLEEIHDPMIDAMFNAILGTTAAAFFGAPTNPDGSSFLPMGDSYFNRLLSHDRQIAGFGEVNFKLTDTLKLIAGVRVAQTKFSIQSLSDGPQNSGPRPGAADSSETPVTPKAGIQWQADPADMYYFTYAKGFRMGGGNPTIPFDPTFTTNPNLGCTPDFSPANLNLPNGAPPTYKSDRVQSFELGAKNNFNNRFRLASSIYYIKWSDIQGNVVPPICQIQFTTNLGDAVSKGFDVQADFEVGDSLTVESAFGYTDARYTKDFFLGASALPLVANGDAIAGPNGIGTGFSIPPWTATVGAQYRFAPFGHQSFLRLDYEYEAADKWLHATLDPNTSLYDNKNHALPSLAFPMTSQSFLSLRGGTTVADVALAVFVDNVTDSHTTTNFNHQTNSYDTSTPPNLLVGPAYRYISYRPRTFGLSATYRY